METLGSHARPILVGVDGSTSSLAALRWAYAEAVRTQAPLEVLTAWPSRSRDAGALETEQQARAIATQAIATELPADNTIATAWVSPIPGEPCTVLLRRTHKAALLAVGPHGRHSVTEHLLGSVTEHLLAEASCPVAVVPADSGQAPATHRIVVGVDGSPASLVALRWAAERAAATGSKVDALLAWEWRPEYAVYPYGPDERQQHARAEAALARAALTLPDQLRALVHSEPVRGHAADVLLAAGDAADLLVVGNSRAAHLPSHLLGSVSRKAALHSRVPVVVTHAPAPQRAADTQPSSR